MDEPGNVVGAHVPSSQPPPPGCAETGTAAATPPASPLDLVLSPDHLRHLVETVTQRFRAHAFDAWAYELRQQRPYIDDSRYERLLERLDNAIEDMHLRCEEMEERITRRCMQHCTDIVYDHLHRALDTAACSLRSTAPPPRRREASVACSVALRPTGARRAGFSSLSSSYESDDEEVTSVDQVADERTLNACPSSGFAFTNSQEQGHPGCGGKEPSVDPETTVSHIVNEPLPSAPPVQKNGSRQHLPTHARRSSPLSSHSTTSRPTGSSWGRNTDVDATQ